MKQFHLTKQQTKELMWKKLQKKLKISGSESVDNILTKKDML